MDTGKPITVFLVTALLLWAVYLYKHGRLGKSGLLPGPPQKRPSGGQPLPPGWKPGAPPILPDVNAVGVPRF